ncbi:hypothetical protein CPLU01_12746 [Colletotrichum plurivorum]|uniref:Fungal N-terminal domain-containing protein n=1 Tax=Colletotrichum plurivorum TaxID=2175906 RepID=A0A8H6JVZ0_9PEZI|nr:hypothetical protein CPLU01_12746 [Colletotrichum plurivorum]
MAEPVGTAVGILSLGLQLYGTITKYLDAVKGRERDLVSAQYQAHTLRQCLSVIDSVVTQARETHAAASDAVEACISACETELRALEALVIRLQGPTTPAATISAKAKARVVKYAFPFHKDSILALEKRLLSTNQVLQTGLHALGL